MMDWASIPFLGDIDETRLVDDRKPSLDDDSWDVTTQNTTPETLDLTPLSLQETTVCTSSSSSSSLTPKRLFPKASSTIPKRRPFSTTSSPVLPATIHLSSDHGTRMCSRANWRQSEEVLRGSLRQYEPFSKRNHHHHHQNYRTTVPEPFVLQTALRAATPPSSSQKTPPEKRYVFRARPLPRFYGTTR